MDEARGEEATQCGQQQQCILSGGVYLRHRLRKANSKNIFQLLFSQKNYIIRILGVQDERSGVLACKKLSLNSTRHHKYSPDIIESSTRFK
jgi:hypothetical protein